VRFCLISRRLTRFVAVLGALVLVAAGLAQSPASAQPAVVAPVVKAVSHTEPVKHSVSWDKYSVMVDGRRLVVWSGEFHPFRLPSPSLWRDILQKMKSSGYNAVSFYTDWGYHSAKQGVYDFTGVRDMDRFLDLAAEVGIYVVARPGPYINAEVDGGGFPAWLANTPGKARTSDPAYLTYADEWLDHIDSILARHQLTDGTGTVLLYQIENEYASNVNSATGKDYMAHLYAKVRADGITVPIFHNDKGRNGYWVPGSFSTPSTESPANYMYGFDGYPAGTCSTSGNPGTPGTPPDWGYYGTVGASASPTTPGLLAEFGGGWFDPWGDKLWGGAGYPCMRARQSGSMERQYYLTNIANGIKIQNVYMTYGGTSWGWLPAPIVYTSYDYGAAIDEARNLTGKVGPMKEMGYFLQSVPDIAKIDKAADVTPSNSAVKTYHLANPDTGTQFYFVRSDSTAADYDFTLPITTADGSYTLPLHLKGVDMKALVADYAMDAQHLVYSTSEIMTHAANLNGQDVALLHTRDGQNGETVLRYADATARPTVTTVSGTAPAVSWDDATKDLKLDYTGSGLSEVRISGPGIARPLLLLLAADSVADTFWRLDTANGPVLVRGPELLRTAAVAGRRVELTGDTKDAASLEVWAPHAAEVTWNGARVRTGSTAAGSLLAGDDLAGAPSITLPVLTNWKYSAESPEAQPGFDDSAWTVANKTTSTSTTKVPAGQPVLFADDYGFHHGDVWYRGTYTAAADATQVDLTFQSGQVGLMEAWLDGRHLGTYQIPTPTSGQSTTQDWSGTAAWTIPEDLRTAGGHELSVLVRPMAHDEDGGANDAQKTARGLTSATFTGSTAPITWKIQGGDPSTDTVRGPLNNGGLYGERAGWYLPGYPDKGWSDAGLPSGTATAGVSWYRTSFRLHLPQGVDSSLGLTITDDPSKAYRALIFVNGWNLGQYINDVGPQHTFVLPNGILKPDGTNTVAIAVTSNDDGAGLGSVSLTDLGTVRGGTDLKLVGSPSYQAPRLAGVPVRATAGTAVTARVATAAIPADARGTAFGTTIDWGDGTTSAGTIGTDGSVTGTHAYARPGHYRIEVRLADTYGPPLASAGTEAAVTR
jgi:beta-galactosidase GanA